MLRDSWDLVLLIVAGYVAIVTLVRLMLRRRDQVTERFRAEMKKEKARTRGGEKPTGGRAA